VARADGKPENQHYVPKMLLRQFSVPGDGKEPQIHVYDKRDDKAFRTAVANVVAEREFYELPHPSGTVSLEPAFSELETKTAPALEKLIAARRLDALAGEEKSWLALFVAAQRLRVRSFRQTMKHLNDMIAEKIRGMGGDPSKVKGWDQIDGGDELKVASSLTLFRLIGKIAPMIENKRWVLFEPPPGEHFWISDNPVAMNNEEKFGPYGNLGFAVPGIEIYAPLSPPLLLGMWCPTREQKLKLGLAQASSALRMYRTLGIPPTVGATIEGH
jgi:hypothetical protein